MTTEKPSAYARAESGSRRVVLQIGLGVLAFVLGSILSVGATARIGERIGTLDNDYAIFAFRWVFERLWLFLMLPVFGYAMGRFTEVKPSGFALTAALSGETFSVLLVTAINGFDYLLQDRAGLIARGLTLFAGLLITARAVEAGRVQSAEAQAEADVIAEARKVEYAAFLAAAEGKADVKAQEPAPASETSSPHPDPLPVRGEGES